MTKNVFPLVLILILSISGCAYKQKTAAPFIPFQKSGTDAGVEIRVNPSAGLGNYKVSKYLTTFYVEIDNQSKNEITFNSDDIVLIDELNNQYNLLSPNIAAKIVKESSRTRFFPQISIGIGVGHGHYHGGYYRGYSRFHSPFRHRFHYYYDDPYPYDYPQAYSYTENVSEVYSEALFPGSVLPGSTLKGFIYFKKLPADIMNVNLGFGFETENDPERRAIKFSFKR